MQRSNQRLAKGSEQARLTALAAAFLLVTFLLGGGSRSDIMSLPFLRALAGATLVLTMFLAWPRLVLVRGPLIFLGVAALVILLQLTPLPHNLWSALPGRELLADIDATAQIGEIARPMAVDPFAAWNALFSLLVPTAALALFALVDKEGQKKFVSLILVVVAVAALMGFGQLVGGSGSSLYLYRITNQDSAVGLFSNRNHHALLLACGLPLLALWFSTLSDKVEKLRLYQLVAVIGVALLIPAIVTTGSRAGLVFILVGFCAAASVYRTPVMPPQRRDKPIALFDIRKLVGGAIALGLVATLLSGRLTAFDRVSLGADKEVDRLAMLPTLWQMVVDFFPFGAGAGSFVPLFRVYEPIDLLNPSYYNHAHNDIMEILIDFGLLGVIALVVAVGWWAVSALKVWAIRPRSGPTFAWQAGHCGLWILLMCALASIVDYPLRVPAVQVLAALSVVWVVLAIGERNPSVVKAELRG